MDLSGLLVKTLGFVPFATNGTDREESLCRIKRQNIFVSLLIRIGFCSSHNRNNPLKAFD